MTIADAWEQLEVDMLGEPPDYETEAIEVPDAFEANRAIGWLARERRKRAALREVAEAQIEQVQRWLEAAEAKHVRAIEYHTGQLAQYHAAVLAKNPKAKTIELPNGTLTSRAQQPVWEFDDEAFIAWARDHAPEAVRYPPAPDPEIDKAEAKNALTRRDGKGRAIAFGVTEDGETPPGVTVTSRDPKFEVSIHGDDTARL